MKLLVRHQTSYSYESGAERVAMMLKLHPVDGPTQAIEQWSVSVNGMPLENFARNSRGDMEAVWISRERLNDAVIVAEGVAETREMHGIVGWPDSRVNPCYFLRETPLTAASDAIRDMALNLDVVGGVLGRLHALSAAVSDAVVYRAGVTGADTTAADAFALGTGVCQDHAQIFIAGARTMGVPARYVSGYLLSQNGGALHETHGWAEVLVPDLGWVGFDPSNQTCITEHYLRLAGGLDAYEAAPLRGLASVAGMIWIDADVRIAQALPGVEERQLQRQQQQTAFPTDPGDMRNTGADLQ